MARRVELLAAGEVQAGPERLPLTLRLDPRARRLTLRLVGDTVRVTCPGRRHVADAVRLAEARAGWLADRRAARPARVAFRIGAALPVFGTARRVVPAAKPAAAARLTPDAIVTGGADEAAVARRVEALLRREARTWLAERADAYAARLGLPPCPVAVREVRSRWGSCSAAPALSFSWRLALAPPEVAAYVAAHEVAHRRHMDHSGAFWTVVAELDPCYEAHDAWLREHGAQLHSYG